MKTGIIVAMTSEFNLAAEHIDNKVQRSIRHLNFIEGTLNGKEVVLMQSGIGKVNAAAAAVEMINTFQPDIIVNTGIAGGIDGSLSVMDVVIGAETTYHDVWCGEGEYGQIQGLPAHFSGDEQLIQAARNISSDIKIHFGLTVSGDKFISDFAELQSIKKQFPEALAVDMESAAIAQICHLYHIPYLSVRLISDTPGIENHYEQYLDFWKLAPAKSFDILEKLIKQINIRS